MDLKAVVSDLIKIQGEPFGSTSIFAQYKVFELASEAGVKVMLDGQGADEMLGGYIPYLSARLASMLAHGSIADACRFYRRACSRLGTGPVRVLNMALGLLLPGFLQGLAAKAVGVNLFPRWMNGSWFSKYDIKQLQPWQSRGPYHLRSQLEKSLQQLTLPMLLRYEDRNSMRFSIESRVPFLTPEMVEFVYTLPESFLINDDGETKSVFRAAMRGMVPDVILDRRDKVGFATSETEWLRALGPWVESKLTSEVAKSIPAFNTTDMIACWKSALEGQQVMGSHFWRWVNLIEWASIFNAEFSE
jgi:asparagine synthase (glutamine-hydrolysing)